MIASIERQVETFKDKPSTKKFVEHFNFPELKDRVGLFIVEFIGNGMSARAVIKKGSLSLVCVDYTIGGHLCYILDEQRKIVASKNNGTGVHLYDQFYPAIPEKDGQIFIPYSLYSEYLPAVLVHEGYADIDIKFERLSEAYKFNALIHIDPESILIGNKAQALIKP